MKNGVIGDSEVIVVVRVGDMRKCFWCKWFGKIEKLEGDVGYCEKESKVKHVMATCHRFEERG